MIPEKIALQGVQETLLLPLWGRAMEMQKDKPLLHDPQAARIIQSIDYDFSRAAARISALTRASWIARCIYFDRKIREYLARRPAGTVVNIGCGFDTTFDRIDNGQATWYELDLPEVIASRRRLLDEAPRHRFLPYSVFDEAWFAQIKDKEDVFLLLAGVIYYFTADEVRAMLETFQRHFTRSTLTFDYASPGGVKMANRQVIEGAGMDETAYLKWGIDDIRLLEQWNPAVKVVDSMKMFHEHRQRFPLQQRLGMGISDAMAVMSLATLTIG